MLFRPYAAAMLAMFCCYPAAILLLSCFYPAAIRLLSCSYPAAILLLSFCCYLGFIPALFFCAVLYAALYFVLYLCQSANPLHHHHQQHSSNNQQQQQSPNDPKQGQRNQGTKEHDGQTRRQGRVRWCSITSPPTPYVLCLAGAEAGGAVGGWSSLSTFQVGRSFDRRRALARHARATRSTGRARSVQTPGPMPGARRVALGVRNHHGVAHTRPPPPLASLDSTAIMPRRRCRVEKIGGGKTVKPNTVFSFSAVTPGICT